MMAPTVVLRDGRPEIAIGSAGSNRIRSAILQTVLGVVDDGLPAQEAVSAPRLHVEDGAGGRGAGRRPAARWTASSRRAGRSRRWSELNLFFGGVQAVARNPDTGRLTVEATPAGAASRRWSTSDSRTAPAASAGRLAEVDPAEAEGLVAARRAEVVHRRVSRLRMPDAVSVGNSCHSTPATPEACGVAIEVPDSVAYWPPGIVDSMSTPGAATSTSAFAFENDARASFWSVAATETTSA